MNPTNLAVTVNPDHSVSASWQNNNPTEIGVMAGITQKPRANKHVQTLHLPALTTSCEFGVAPNGQYFFDVESKIDGAPPGTALTTIEFSISGHAD